MNKKMTEKMMFFLEDEMNNIIFEVEQDEDNLEFDSCFGWLSDRYQDYYRYLQFYKALFKDLKHPTQKRFKKLAYFIKEENYFIERIQKEAE